MIIFTANRLSNGNRIFPVEVHVDEYSITIKKPGLITSTQKTMTYKMISSVELSTSILGFTKIKFMTIGLDSMLVEGFERSDAEEIKRLVEIKLR